MPRAPLHPGSAQELKFAVLEELRRLKKDSEKVLVAFVQGAGNELHGEDDNKLLQFLLTSILTKTCYSLISSGGSNDQPVGLSGRLTLVSKLRNNTKGNQ
jgi:hypothetical protein